MSLLLMAKYVLCCIMFHVPSWDFRSGHILWTDSEIPFTELCWTALLSGPSSTLLTARRIARCYFLAFREGWPVWRGAVFLEGRGTLQALPLKSLVRTCCVESGRMLFVGWMTCRLIWTTIGWTEMLYLRANLAWNIRDYFDRERDKDYWRFVLGFTGTVIGKLRLEYLKFM